MSDEKKVSPAPPPAMPKVEPQKPIRPMTIEQGKNNQPKLPPYIYPIKSK